MIDRYVEFAGRLADIAAGMVQRHAAGPSRATLKPDRSFVTELDLAIEKELRAAIEREFPEHGILGEEFPAVRPDAEWIWVLDPIDGTVAFMAGMPVHGTLIALAHRRVPVVGVIHFPSTHERWVGARGQPTRLNGEACATRAGETLEGAIQSSSNPDFFDVSEKPVLDAISRRTAWRVYGGAAMSYGRLASGRIDVAVDTGLKIHDFAPFVPIIEGAGGMITDWEGAPITLDSGPRILAAGDARRHAAALAVIRSAL